MIALIEPYPTEDPAGRCLKLLDYLTGIPALEQGDRAVAAAPRSQDDAGHVRKTSSFKGSATGSQRASKTTDEPALPSAARRSFIYKESGIERKGERGH